MVRKCPHCGFVYKNREGKTVFMCKQEGTTYRRMAGWEVDDYEELRQEKLQTAQQQKATETTKKTANNGCFIATATYGTPLANEVDLLMRFRDENLARFRAGQVFIAIYYRLSPPVANVIKQSRVLRAITRAALRPIVWLIRK